MKITVWIRPFDLANDNPTVRTDIKCEDRDTPTIQRLGRKFVAAIGGDENGAPMVVEETNGEIIKALHELAAGNLENAKKRIQDGDLAQVFLDAAKIVEAWTEEHGEFKRGGGAV